MKRLILIILFITVSLSCGGGAFIPTPTGGNVEITTPGTSLPTATKGQAYSFQMQATGGTGTSYAWAATGLPKGLTISSSGLISGIPTQTGKFEVDVIVVAK